MFSLLGSWNRHFLVADSRIGSGPPTTPLPTLKPLQRQEATVKKDLTELKDQKAVRQDAQTQIETLDKNLAISSVKELVTADDQKLIDGVKAKVNSPPPNNVPSDKEIEKLKKLVEKVQKHIKGEIETVGTTSRFIFFNKDQKFTDQFQLRNKLEKSLAEAPNDTAKAHYTKQLEKLDAKIHAKLDQIEKVGKYMKTEERHKIVMELVAKDPVAALKVAGSGKATPTLLAKIAEAHGNNPEIAKKLLGNDKTPDTAIQKLFEKANNSAEILELVAKHKNTPADVLKQLADSNQGDAVLKAVAKHKNTDLVSLEKLINKEGSYDNTRAEALRRVPDLSGLAAETLRKLDTSHPAILRTEVEARSKIAVESVDATIKRPSALKLQAVAADCDRRIEELRKLQDSVSNQDLKTKIGEQMKELQGARDRVQAPLDKMERTVSLSDALLEVKKQRYGMDKQTDKFRTADFLGDKLGTAHSYGKNLVNTFGRLERINDQLNQDKDATLAAVSKLHSLYSNKHGTEEAVELLHKQRNALKGLDPSNAAERLENLQAVNKQLTQKLEQAVKDGKLSPSEKENLVALSRNVEKAISAYKQGTQAVTTRETEIFDKLQETSAKGLPTTMKLATELCTEVQTRLDSEHQGRLKLPFAIDPKYVEGLKIDATDVFKNEVKPVMAKLLDQYGELMVQGTEKTKKILGEGARAELVNFISVQKQKLDHFDNPAKLADLQKLEATLKKQLNPEELTALQGLDGAVDNAIKSYQTFIKNADDQITKLETKNTKVTEKVAFIREVLKTGAASGGSDAYSLSISVKTPVPGLSLDFRGGYTFSFQRNQETGAVDVVYQKEGGVGASYGEKGAKIGAEVLGGVKDKFTFKTPEQAAEFLHFVETGLPVDYKMPNATKVGYGGFKAQLEVGVSQIAKVQGDASFIYSSERRPNGDEVTIKKGSVGAKIEVKPLDALNMGTLDVPRMGKLGGSMEVSFSVDAKVSYQTKSFYHNGVPVPEKDKTITEVEVTIGAGLDGNKLESLLKHLVTAGTTTPDVLKKMGLMEKDGEGRLELLKRLVAPLSGGTLEVGAVLKVEYENGEPIGVYIGAKGKVKSEIPAELGIVSGKVKIEKEVHALATVWVPQSSAGLARMESYYLNDPTLCEKTLKTAGWKDTDTVIDSKGVTKTVAEWKVEWKKKAGETKELAALKDKFMVSGGRADELFAELASKGGKDFVILGKKLSEHVDGWREELKEKSMLQELKSIYLSDMTTLKSRYREAKEERSLSGNFGRNFILGDKTVMADRYLWEHEQEWANEQGKLQKERYLRDDVR